MPSKTWILALLLIAACSSGGGEAATLVLKNPTWDQVHVEAVITTREDCNSHGPGYVKTEHFLLSKGDTQEIVAPHDEAICWRHDRNPNHPSPGAWTGWSRASLYPGQTYETAL
jgi:hypothetical protein